MAGQGYGGGLGIAHTVGNLVGVDGRSGDVLGVAAVQVNPNTQLGGAVLVVAIHTVFAGVTLDPVFQQHPVPHLQGGIGVGTDGSDFPRHVHAHDAGTLTAAAPAAHAHVGPVQGAAADPQHNLAGRHFGVRQVAIHHCFRPARFLKINGFHGKYLLKYKSQVARILQEGETRVKGGASLLIGCRKVDSLGEGTGQDREAGNQTGTGVMLFLYRG